MSAFWLVDAERPARHITIDPDSGSLSTDRSASISTSSSDPVSTRTDPASMRVDGSFLLRAALDHGTSDAALRLLAGIQAEVANKMAKPGRVEAYVPITDVERLTGLDRRTIYAVADEVTDRLGGLALTRRGQTFVLAEDGDFGIAATWTTAPLVPQAATLVPGLDVRLDDHQWMPGNECWSRQHRAWRLYLCLIATHGRVRLDHVSTKEIVQLIGGAPQHARRVFRALQTAVHSVDGVGVDLTMEMAEIWRNDFNRANSFIDRQTEAANRAEWLRKAKQARGDVTPDVTTTVIAPTPIGTCATDGAQSDDPVDQARMQALRRLVQGDPRPGYERALRAVEDELIYERAREHWTGDRGKALIEALASRRDALRSQIEALATR